MKGSRKKAPERLIRQRLGVTGRVVQEGKGSEAKRKRMEEEEEEEENVRRAKLWDARRQTV